MSQKKIWYETLHANFGQYFTVENVLYHNKTEHQDLVIFENAELGRIMALDGVVQTTERDECIYHEMMAHVPLFAHSQAKRVLIIGGGDGGMLREVCRHQYLDNIIMVEIDVDVVEFCRQYLPSHNAGSYDDPRFKLVMMVSTSLKQRLTNSTSSFLTAPTPSALVKIYLPLNFMNAALVA
ncbi:spermidine synthase [Xenorhabdus hominickii]|uniref:Polyamine aminopropyltransferase n=1 Tax=Xenorhabdus hominickii TaxID=351679 RepID=A0A2G0Q491_XENHO|nr:spermidine synthase [Xenorhabdus hominickii]